MLVPTAWQNVETMDPDLRAFYEYNSMHMEPWDGPAGIVMTDGRYAVCLLDRNGLRPAGWVTTTNGFKSEEQPSELQSLMRNSYAGFCFKKKTIRTRLPRESKFTTITRYTYSS